MAITARVGLACTITVSTDGTELTFIDTTGTYNASTNPTGYGLTGGITSASVTQFTLVLGWGSLDTSITYTFTVASNVITAATLTDTGGTVYNILSQLTSTVFPFVSANSFNLVTAWTNTGIEMPDFEDDVYTLDYTISGTYSGDAYAYTTSAAIIRTFDVCCCLNGLALQISGDCSCEETKLMSYIKGDAYLSIAGYAANVGKTDDAVTILAKAQSVCDQSSDCGCNE